ncbi:DNA recombination protein RmuC [Candidatus Fermentibacterales bacterium]|nr:DNA recombination protein RmuC [Candidatus Fermentibacterales bacterium]
MSPLVIVALILGALLGALSALLISRRGGGRARDVAREIAAETRAMREMEAEKTLAQLREAVGSAAIEALSRNTEQFMKLASGALDQRSAEGAKELESKKKLIDQTLGRMQSDLVKVETLVKTLEKDREQKFGDLSRHLETSIAQARELRETTGKLSKALASSNVRGQWGERMAEDVLRLAGFVKDVNYLRQSTEGSGRPDYTFLLPEGLKVNMDVKFPLVNYLGYVNAETDEERERYRQQFLKDARSMVRGVAGREYIDPEAGTLDCVLVFIPNEQVYAFLNEQDATIIDYALSMKVVLCSPLTLYAVLAVIRTAMDNFNTRRRAYEVLSVVSGFRYQWGKFLEEFGLIGKRIKLLQVDYDKIDGTRARQMQRVLDQVDDLRSGSGYDEEEKSVALREGEETRSGDEERSSGGGDPESAEGR